MLKVMMKAWHVTVRQTLSVMLTPLRGRFRLLRRRQVEPLKLQELHDNLAAEATLNTVYLILIVGSCAIATFGLLTNSTAVIIGAMIIAPLMLPIRGLALGNWSLSLGAGLLYLTNLLGITLACMVTFLLAGYTPFKQARKALIWAIAFTVMLLLPLSVSFARLVQQTRLESSLRAALLTRTITFQSLELVSFDTDWLSTPPQVRLTVRSQKPITPKQVQLLEAFVKQEMGRPFTLIFAVSQVEEVTRNQTTGATTYDSKGSEKVNTDP
jgi:uncharacterized membrane protein